MYMVVTQLLVRILALKTLPSNPALYATLLLRPHISQKYTSEKSFFKDNQKDESASDLSRFKLKI